MKTKTLISLLACTFFSSAIFAEVKSAPRKQKVRLSPKQIAEGQMRSFGGFIDDRRNEQGIVALINAQNIVSSNALVNAGDIFGDSVLVSVKVCDGSFDPAKKVQYGEIVVFVIDDPDRPMSLLSIEEGWGVVNVSKLKHDNKAFLEARVKKEIVRILTYLCGAASTRFENCITGCITKAEDLDNLTDIIIPVEMKDKITKYMPGLGIKPYQKVSYEKACKEGWAPSPTNEYQKAIWDEIHELPTNPIQIKPETKKVTE